MKKIFLLLLIILSFSYAKYYELGEVNIIYEISRNGNVYVTEEFTYLLKDCESDPFREVYLDKPYSLILKNPFGYCVNTKCNFRYDTYNQSESGNNKLVLELLQDKCGEIKTKYTYEVYPIVVAKDTTQFYYMIWGEGHQDANIYVKIVMPEYIYTNEKVVETIEKEVFNEETNETRIIYEEMISNETNKNIIYYIHKEDNNYIVNEFDKTLEIYSTQKNNEIFEINLLMPKEWFVESNNFIYRKDLSKKDIVEIEEKELLYREYKGILEMILSLLFLLYLIVPFIILAIMYHLYGKEYTAKEINYNALYEREIPSEHSPAEVIFFVKGDEEYNMKDQENAIISTIMSFVNKGIASIEEKNNDVFLTFDHIKVEKMKLQKFEESLLEFIKKEFGNKTFSIKEFEKRSANKLEYYQLINRFFMHVSKINKKSEFVENQGNKIGIISIGVYILLTFIIMFFQPLALFGLLFAFVTLIIIKSKKIMLAKWTEKGRLLNLKWENFRKYITDYSLMKEHPPESVKLWDEYLTYAIALGVADKTINIMKKMSPKEKINKNSISHVYFTVPLALNMTNSFRPSYVSKSSGGYSGGGYSGGVGGFGGGMGGGGSGAR